MNLELDPEVKLALEQAYRENPMFFMLTSFTPDVQAMVESFWTDGYTKGVLAARLQAMKGNEQQH